MCIRDRHSTGDEISGELVDQIVGQLKQGHHHEHDAGSSHSAVYVVPQTVAGSAPGAVPPPQASLQEIEAQHIADLLSTHNGNRRLVADALGISERTLYRKLKKFGLG